MKKSKLSYYKILFSVLALVLALTSFAGCGEEKKTDKDLFLSVPESDVSSVISELKTEMEKYPLLDKETVPEKIKGSVSFQLGDISASGMNLSMNISLAAQFIADIANGKSQVQLDATAFDGAASVTVYNDSKAGKTVVSFGDLLDKAASFEGTEEELVEYLTSVFMGSASGNDGGSADFSSSNDAMAGLEKIVEVFAGREESLTKLFEDVCSEKVFEHIIDMIADTISDDQITSSKEKITVSGNETECDAIKFVINEQTACTIAKTFLNNAKDDSELKELAQKIYNELSALINEIDALNIEGLDLSDFPATFDEVWSVVGEAADSIDIPETFDSDETITITRYFKDDESLGFKFDYFDGATIQYLTATKADKSVDSALTVSENGNVLFTLETNASKDKISANIKVTANQEVAEIKCDIQKNGDKTDLMLKAIIKGAEATINAQVNIKENSESKLAAEVATDIKVLFASEDQTTGANEVGLSFVYALELELPENVDITVPSTEDTYDLKDSEQVQTMVTNLLPNLQQEFSNLFALIGSGV